MAFSGLYLAARMLFTAVGANPWLFGVLLGAEVIGWLAFSLYILTAWRPRRQLAPREGDSSAIDIIISTVSEPAGVLEPTLIGAVSVRANAVVWVLDDGNRDWLRDMCQRYGVQYVRRHDHRDRRAGSINHVLPMLRGDFVLVLDADHVPSPHAIESLIPYFDDERVAIVQTPYVYRNTDSIQHSDSATHDQSLVFDVVLPGCDRLDAVFWCGSGALLRTSALRDIGGMSAKTSSQSLETSLDLYRNGWRARYHNASIVNGVAAENLAEATAQRYLTARGSLENLLSPRSPLFSRGFPVRARLAYLSNLLFYILPLQQLMYAAVLLTVLLSGELPLTVSPAFVLGLWLPQLVLVSLASWLCSNGNHRPFAGARSAWLAVGILPKALFDTVLHRRNRLSDAHVDQSAPSHRTSVRILIAPILAVVLLAGALTVRLFDQVTRWALLPSLNSMALLACIGFVIYDALVLLPLIVRLLLHVQLRHTWRVESALDALVGGVSAEVEDLNEYGARIRASQLIMDSILERGEVEIAIRTQTARGESIWAHGILVPTRITPADFGEVLLAGPILWKDERSRVAVVEYCYVTHPVTQGAPS